MATPRDTIFGRVRSFFGDRRSGNGTPPPGTTCRRGKSTARFGGASDWYLSTSMQVEEMEADADKADTHASTVTNANTPPH